MKRWIPALIAAALLTTPGRASAADHLVSDAARSARLSDAAAERAQHVRSLESVLATKAAAAATARLGVRLEDVRAALPTLSDGELRDLAARASLVRSDPVAGFRDDDVNDLLVIFLVVAIVIVVLSAVH